VREKTIIITESEGKYRIQNTGLSEFDLIGILECIVFDMKSVRRQEIFDKTTESSSSEDITKQSEETTTGPKVETVRPPSSPDLWTRINNAVKAIKVLGGQADEGDQSNTTYEELQTELEELTNQYKRLKNSKGAGK
jgi:hypothetical protein